MSKKNEKNGIFTVEIIEDVRSKRVVGKICVPIDPLGYNDRSREKEEFKAPVVQR